MVRLPCLWCRAWWDGVVYWLPTYMTDSSGLAVSVPCLLPNVWPTGCPPHAMPPVPRGSHVSSPIPPGMLYHPYTKGRALTRPSCGNDKYGEIYEVRVRNRTGQSLYCGHDAEYAISLWSSNPAWPYGHDNNNFKMMYTSIYSQR